MRYRIVLPATISFLLLAGGCSGSGSDSGAATATTSASTGAPSNQTVMTGGDAIHYEDVRAFIEYNAGDKDLGFHVEFGGEPWTTATITDPDGNVVFDLTGGGSLTQQGLATVFFESGEYGLDELSRDEFLGRFPEGDYTFVGQTVDGRILADTWAFTHLIPDPPSITSPAEDATVDRGAVTVAWQPVTTPAGVDVGVPARSVPRRSTKGQAPHRPQHRLHPGSPANGDRDCDPTRDPDARRRLRVRAHRRRRRRQPDLRRRDLHHIGMTG